MTAKELAILLDELRVRHDAYSLNGGLPSEAYCLGFVDGHWEVYYSERGQKSGLQLFDSEHDACRALADLIVNDPTTRS